MIHNKRKRPASHPDCKCHVPTPILAGCAKCGATRFVGEWIYDKNRAPFLCERCEREPRR